LDQTNKNNIRFRKEVYKDGKLIAAHDDRLLPEEKTGKIAEIKAHANALLQKTDWCIIRFTEGNHSVDTDVLVRRDSIRKASNTAESAIVSCKSLLELDQCNWMKYFDTI